MIRSGVANHSYLLMLEEGMPKQFLLPILIALIMLFPVLAQSDEYKSPSDVVIAYFQALGKRRFDEMPNYLHPELLKDIKQNIIYSLILGKTDDVPFQLLNLSREEIEAKPDTEVAGYMIPHTLATLGGTLETYSTVKPAWANEDDDRAYVVIKYKHIPAGDGEPLPMMSLIPLKKFEGKWFLLNGGELIIITDYLNFNDYE